MLCPFWAGGWGQKDAELHRKGRGAEPALTVGRSNALTALLLPTPPSRRDLLFVLEEARVSVRYICSKSFVYIEKNSPLL